MLIGRGGDDSLYGGSARDMLKGGAGADRFIYTVADDSFAGSQRDVILDFEAGTDKLDFSSWRAWIAGNTATYAAPTEFSGIRYEIRHEITARGSTLVQFDVDGDSIADFEIKLLGPVTLNIDDFVF